MGRVYFPTKNNIGVRTLGAVSPPTYDYTNFHAPAEPPARAAAYPVNLGAIVMVQRALPADGPLSNRLPARVINPAIAAQNSPTPVVITPGYTMVAPIVTSGGGTASPSTGSDLVYANENGVQPIYRGVIINNPPPQPVPPAATPTPGLPPTVSQQTTSTPTVNTTTSPAPATATQTPATSGQLSYDSFGNVIDTTTGQIVVPAVSSSGSAAANAATPAAAAASSGIVDQISAWLGGVTAIGTYNIPNPIIAGVVALGFAWLSSGTKRR